MSGTAREDALPQRPGFGRYDRRLWPLFFGRVITSLGHGISYPFLAIYFTSQLQVSAWLAGGVISVGAVVGGVAKYVGGSLSDRLGRKGVMLSALAGRAATTVGIGLLALHPQPSWVAVAALFVLGSAFGRIFDPASQAMVADISDERTRTAGYGLLRVGTNFGWAVGVMAGGLIGKESYAGMFLTTSVVIAVSFLVILALVRETAPLRAPRTDGPPEARSGGLRRRLAELDVPGFYLLCGVGILVHVVMAQLMMPLSVFGKEILRLSEDQIGLLFFLNGMMVVVLQFPASRFVEQRFRMTTSLALGSLFFAAGYGSIGFTGGMGLLAVCVAVFTFGELLVAPGTVALAANLAPEDRRGLFLGAFGLATMGGRFVGPLLGGVNLDLFREAPWVHWVVVGVLSTAAAAGFLLLRFRIAEKADLG